VEPDKIMPNHLETGQTCLLCKGPQGTDDKGASAAHGFLCKRCGCYRLPRIVKPAKGDQGTNV
jgi:hypothetical protein